MATHRPMPNADAAWLHMDRPTNRMVINAVLWFDEPLDLEALRVVVRERMVERYPSFRRRAVEHGALGGADWEDDPHFDLDLHLHHLALPAPGDLVALQQLVGELASMPLSREKPLWDAYLVDGYGDGCALVLRMHHCIADGIALARVMLSIADADADADADAARPPAGRGRAAPGLPGPLAPLARTGWALAETVVHEGAELAAHPGRLPDLAGGAAADARTLAKLLLAGRDPQTAIHGELGPVQRVAWSEPYDLAAIKAIARAHGTTINDVLVSAVSGALARHIGAYGDTPDEIHAMVPFNLRPLDEPLAPELGNRFGLVLLGLPLTIDDPGARLRAVHERMTAIKRSPEGAVTYGILGAMGVLPVAVESRAIDFFTAKASLVLTNVPGPRAAVRVAGSRVGGVLVWAPCAGAVSMSVSVFSYAGVVSVGFLVDAGLVPDPDALVARLGDELAALAATT
jgi:WS/DGAT/MGAT family acyltransferase